MHTDPILAALRGIKHAYDHGDIDDKIYESMYAAIARAAEQDSQPCANDPAHGPAVLYHDKRPVCATCKLAELGR